MSVQIGNSKGKVRIGGYTLLRKLLLGFIVISLLNLFISYCFYTPKLHSIDNQNRELVLKYNILQRVRLMRFTIVTYMSTARSSQLTHSLLRVYTIPIQRASTPRFKATYTRL